MRCFLTLNISTQLSEEELMGYIEKLNSNNNIHYVNVEALTEYEKKATIKNNLMKILIKQ